ncbi:hypothetical protein BVRB_016270 [Beta vulgaris subsp. vulgaris]|uniref:Uncharacterized protein n=1 Tax=Beta vulgaris subsp. vulgaris TaxID=3555 RepID=A0A0J8B4A5_BETVV|nr:hypothetical protein BVRB_016270 [Beta vulgaris subsp. vulgaris]
MPLQISLLASSFLKPQRKSQNPYKTHSLSPVLRCDLATPPHQFAGDLPSLPESPPAARRSLVACLLQLAVFSLSSPFSVARGGRGVAVLLLLPPCVRCKLSWLDATILSPLPLGDGLRRCQSPVSPFCRVFPALEADVKFSIFLLKF